MRNNFNKNTYFFPYFSHITNTQAFQGSNGGLTGQLPTNYPSSAIGVNLQELLVHLLFVIKQQLFTRFILYFSFLTFNSLSGELPSQYGNFGAITDLYSINYIF